MGISKGIRREVPDLRWVVHCAECGMTSDDLSLITCPSDGAILGEIAAQS
jgi:hypothetical protein